MPWNKPGNGGGRDPWKGGGVQRPPDLDEVFANVQRRLQTIMGGGNGKDGGSSGAAGASSCLPFAGPLLQILAVWLARNSAHIIDAFERGVVLRCRQYNPTA